MKIKKPNSTRIGPQDWKNNHNPKDPGKLRSMLKTFANGRQLHRFEAERLGDHCLPSTISSLQMAHDIQFSREWTKVPNRFGTITRVMRYWLAGENLDKARNILKIEREVA